MATAPRQRLAWPDVAKGISIIGVVLLHVTLAVPDAENTAVAAANTMLDPLRMPLFFLISGLFATKIFRFSFRELFERRLWFFLVPYLVWVPVEMYTKNREIMLVHGVDIPGVGNYLVHILTGVNMAWFLYALILFNIALWLCRNLRPGVAVALSVLPLLAVQFHFDWHIAGKAILYLPIFFIGAYGRKYVLLFAQKALAPTWLVATASVYVVGLMVVLGWNRLASTTEIAVRWPLPGMEALGAPEIDLFIRLLSHVLMLPAGITAAVAISKVPVLSQALMFAGRHTLPLYLGHPIALTLLYHFTIFHLGIPVSAEPGHFIVSTGFWMAACLFISLLGGMALWAISLIPGLRWTIAPPPISSLKTRLQDASFSPALKKQASAHL